MEVWFHMPTEAEMYSKVMGIEEARKLQLPMPDGVKIPKRARHSSTGGRCDECGQQTVVGHEDGHGMWHYSCTNCVKNQDPNEVPCPRCGCRANEKIAGSVSSLWSTKHYEIINNPFRPDVMKMRCLRCSQEWTSPEFERYLLTKVVCSVSKKSPFYEP